LERRITHWQDIASVVMEITQWNRPIFAKIGVRDYVVTPSDMQKFFIFLTKEKLLPPSPLSLQTGAPNFKFVPAPLPRTKQTLNLILTTTFLLNSKQH